MKDTGISTDTGEDTTQLELGDQEGPTLGEAETSFSRVVKVVALYAVALLVLSVTVLPYLYMLLQSLAPWDEVNRRFFPTALNIRSYVWIWTGGEVGTPKPWLRALGNSVFVTMVNTFTRVIVGALVGFALAILSFKGRKRVNDFILFHMFYPAIILLVPTFLVIRNLGLYNTYGGMIVPMLVDVWAIFMYTNFFKSIPVQLIEAARIDGAGNFRILRSILLPMSRPMTTVVFLFLFMQRWIVLMWDLIVVKDAQKQTLNVLLQTMFGPYGSYPGPLYAASVLLTFPILVLFSFFSQRFVEGIEFTVQ
jgi:multiple sugar transport system permease protein